jgi:Ni/Co efflux regulator RcnB
MRKILLTLAALAAFGIALPVVSNTADAREVLIVKKHRHSERHWDRGHHYGWNNRHHHRHGAAVVIR